MRSITRAAAVYTPFPLLHAYYLSFLVHEPAANRLTHGRVEQWQLVSLIS